MEWKWFRFNCKECKGHLWLDLHAVNMQRGKEREKEEVISLSDFQAVK